MTIKLRSESKRFWGKVDIQGPDECWEWQACFRCSSYGAFKFNGKMYLAHRVAWILENGEIPVGLCICHTCDHPACRNPAHLFLGTNTENSRDMVGKDRQAQGENHGRHKLLQSEMNEIRDLLVGGLFSQLEIAKFYDVGRTNIQKINTGEIWKEKTDDYRIKTRAQKI